MASSLVPGAYTINHYYYERPDSDGVAHRTGGPAFIGIYPAFDDHYDDSNLDVDWYDHGHLHRLGGPSATGSDGDIFWDVDGNLIARVPTPGGPH